MRRSLFLKIVASLTLLVVIFFRYSGFQFSENLDYLVIEKRGIVCPENADREYSGFGPHGLMLSCKIKHGPFVAAEKGKIVLKGQYSMNKKVGEWVRYDEKGNISLVEIYDGNGELVSLR